MKRFALVAAVSLTSICGQAFASTTTFFSSSQTVTLVSTNDTSDTLNCDGYLFTYSLDKWWSGGSGPPTGRPVSIVLPNGLTAQTITTGSNGVLSSQIGASISVRRADGQTFDLFSFTGKILGNTAGAGAAFEIMPQLNGQDALSNPLTYDATGYGGASFSYSPALTGFDNYIISLWMDFALTSLTVIDTNVTAQPVLEISPSGSGFVLLSWPTNDVGFALQQSSSPGGAGWTTIPGSPNVIGSNYQISIPLTNRVAFFRLTKP